MAGERAQLPPAGQSHTFNVLSSDAETRAARPASPPPRDPFFVAGEGAQLAPAAQLPHLQRIVPRRRDRTLPVRCHRHRIDLSRVAGEGAQLAPAVQLPHLQRCPKNPRPRAARLGVTATALTDPSGRSRVRSSRPLSSSHTFSVLSLRGRRLCASRPVVTATALVYASLVTGEGAQLAPAV